MSETTPTLPRLGGYTLLAQIAHGGMAEVFLAQQEGPQGFQKIVVIKRILPHLARESEFVRMFLDEARLAALINHPNVVSIFELGEEPGTGAYFMAMEYIDGRNLREVADVARRQKRRLEPKLIARLIADTCAGLHFAHELARSNGEPLKIVHRDISPENLLVTYGGLVKIVDFGIAKAAQNENLTRTGQVKGKLSYLAPEQLQAGKVDRRSDIWALGVTLYWLLTGEKPFKGEGEAQIMRAVLEDEPPPLTRRNRETLPPFQSILDKALAKDPANRYSTALAMQNDLERLLQLYDRPVTAATVATTMEKLFPKATDPTRLHHRQILNRPPSMPPDAPEPEPDSSVEVALSESEAVGKPRSRLWLGVFTVAALIGALLVDRTLLMRVTHQSREGASPITRTLDAGALAATTPDAGVVAAAAPPASPLLDAGLHAQAAEATLPAPPPAPSEETLREPPREPTRSHLHPKGGQAGFMELRARPGLMVFVDGRAVGTTPLKPRLIATPGTHHVELVDPRNRVERRSIHVEVREGQTTLVK